MHNFAHILILYLIFPIFILFSEPPEIGPFSFASDTVNEGSFAQITCSIIRGDEPLRISWSLQGDVISSDPAITTTAIGSRTSILIISSVGYRHSGQYTCRAKNPAGADTHSAMLKVNGTPQSHERLTDLGV